MEAVHACLQMKQLLETMCGGDFMSKSPEDAFDFLNYVVDVSISRMNLMKELG